jgi:hypothetical protein
MMLMLEVAGTQGSLGCFALLLLAALVLPSIWFTIATVHEVWRRRGHTKVNHVAQLRRLLLMSTSLE